eukprot:SAG31_NODE_12445_length_942_cov_0.763938_2_plen_46_part_01
MLEHQLYRRREKVELSIVHAVVSAGSPALRQEAIHIFPAITQLVTA